MYRGLNPPLPKLLRWSYERFPVNFKILLPTFIKGATWIWKKNLKPQLSLTVMKIYKIMLSQSSHPYNIKLTYFSTFLRQIVGTRIMYYNGINLLKKVGKRRNLKKLDYYNQCQISCHIFNCLLEKVLSTWLSSIHINCKFNFLQSLNPPERCSLINKGAAA